MKTKLLIFSLLLVSATMASQVVANQVDDFEDGTLQNWAIGGAATNPPTNETVGGPDGRYMSYTTNGNPGGPGSKMVIYSRNMQWSGDYTTPGILAIKFDARAIGADLEIRIGFADETTDSANPKTQIVSTNAVTVTDGTGWASYTIPVSASDFTLLGGSMTIADVLAGVAETRIIRNSVATWIGASGAATLDIDNIIASTSLGVDVFENQQEFSISPNPATSKLNIFLPNVSENAIITVFDVLGKRVYYSELNALISTIDVSKWNSGVYLVRVSTDSATHTKRFLKQ